MKRKKEIRYMETFKFTHVLKMEDLTYSSGA